MRVKDVPDVISQKLFDQGMTISYLSANTGIPEMSLYKSLNYRNRQLKVHEFAMICDFLQLDVKDFITK